MREKTKSLLAIGVSLLVLAGGAFAYAAAHRAYYRSAYPRTYQEYVQPYAAAYGVDEALVYAVMRTESSFNPGAESHIGARGLMQITEDTFEWAKSRMEIADDVRYEDLYTPEANIKYGIFLLKLLTEEFGSTENALCAYHAGWGNAKKWLAAPEYSSDGVQIDNIPFGNTERYVKKVGETVNIYKNLYDL